MRSPAGAASPAHRLRIVDDIAQHADDLDRHRVGLDLACAPERP